MQNSLTSLAIATVIGATGCSSDPLPAVRAVGVERMECDASANSQEGLVPSLRVLRVERLYSHVSTGNTSEERVNGAKLLVRPPEGVRADQLARILQCHGARTLLGQMSSVANDPYFLPDRWVTIDVRPENGNFSVTLSSDTVRDNLQLYGRANQYADEHALATDPWSP